MILTESRTYRGRRPFAEIAMGLQGHMGYYGKIVVKQAEIRGRRYNILISERVANRVAPRGECVLKTERRANERDYIDMHIHRRPLQTMITNFDYAQYRLIERPDNTPYQVLVAEL